MSEYGGEDDAEELPAVWDGKPVGSKEEGRVILALLQLKLDFSYQVSVLGGRARRGGQVVDFIVRTPRQWAVDVVGRYWHKNAGERLRVLVLERLFNRRVVQLFDDELGSVGAAVGVLRKKLL